MTDSTDLYAAYERWKGWDAPFTITDDERRYFAAECRGIQIAEARVLEIGFGSGSFLSWSIEAGATVAGVEVNPAAIEAAKARGIALLPSDLSVAAETHAAQFDTVVAFDVFEHFSLSDIETALDAIETMLVPGGHLLLRFPNAQSPFGMAPQFGDPTHKIGLSRSAFELIVGERAFEFVRYAGSARIGGGGVPRALKRRLRHGLQSTLNATLRFIYATDIPYDPVAVLLLRKSDSKG